MTRRWIFTLPFIAFGCGAIAFYVLNNLPAFSTGSQESLLNRSWSTALEIFVVSAPLLWIIALIAREPLSLAFLKVHAALYSPFLVVTIASNSPGHSSPGEAFAGFIIGFLFIILAGDAIAIMIARIATTESRTNRKDPEFVYVGVTLALLCGGYAGVVFNVAPEDHQRRGDCCSRSPLLYRCRRAAFARCPRPDRSQYASTERRWVDV